MLPVTAVLNLLLLPAAGLLQEAAAAASLPRTDTAATVVSCLPGADATALLGAALNQSHAAVSLLDGRTCISDPLAVVGRQNLTVTLGAGAELQARRGSTLFGALLTLQGVADVTVQGAPSAPPRRREEEEEEEEDPHNLTAADLARPTLRMWRDDYLDRAQYVYSEWRHAIQIEGCARVTLHNLRLTVSERHPLPRHQLLAAHLSLVPRAMRSIFAPAAVRCSRRPPPSPPRARAPGAMASTYWACGMALFPSSRATIITGRA